MSSFVLRPLHETLQHISRSFLILLALGLLHFGMFSLLRRFSTQMEADYGASTPDLHLGFYSSASEFTDTLSTWGADGCRAYIRTDLLARCAYIPTYVALLCAVLYRSLSKMGWDFSLDVVPQVALAMLVADFGETAIWTFGCCGWTMSLPAVAVADLCHQIKTVTILVTGTSLVILMVLQSYMMPFLVLAKSSAKKTTTRTTGSNRKTDSTKKKK